MNKPRVSFAVFLFLALMTSNLLLAQKPGTSKSKKAPEPFRWVNNPKSLPARVQHAKFESPSMKVDVGYCIYLPTQYDSETQSRFPVVYYLHGGRPGSETKSVRLAREIHKHIEAGSVPPIIYVFVNGGPVSHYNMPNRPEAQGRGRIYQGVDTAYRCNISYCCVT